MPSILHLKTFVLYFLALYTTKAQGSNSKPTYFLRINKADEFSAQFFPAQSSNYLSTVILYLNDNFLSLP